jgi:hypothetical protein
MIATLPVLPAPSPSLPMTLLASAHSSRRVTLLCCVMSAAMSPPSPLPALSSSSSAADWRRVCHGSVTAVLSMLSQEDRWTFQRRCDGIDLYSMKATQHSTDTAPQEAGEATAHSALPLPECIAAG